MIKLFGRSTSNCTRFCNCCIILYRFNPLIKRLIKFLAIYYVTIVKMSEPWGTPALTSVHYECWPFNTTLCFLQHQKKFIRVTSSRDIPFCCNLKSKPSCRTLSNALGISRKTTLTSSNPERIACAIYSNWLVQESPGLNTHCFGNIKSFSEKKNENMLL